VRIHGCVIAVDLEKVEDVRVGFVLSALDMRQPDSARSEPRASFMSSCRRRSRCSGFPTDIPAKSAIQSGRARAMSAGIVGMRRCLVMRAVRGGRADYSYRTPRPARHPSSSAEVHYREHLDPNELALLRWSHPNPDRTAAILELGISETLRGRAAGLRRPPVHWREIRRPNVVRLAVDYLRGPSCSGASRQRP
jgi:hypothetical protein